MEDKNLLKTSKAYYENNDYYEIFSQAEDGEKKVANYLKELCIGKITLDAGCGTGKFLPVIEEYASKYIGVDLSNEQISKAKRKSKKNAFFLNTSLESIQLSDSSVDFIISTWVLGTITDLQERKRCLVELKRLLKPNGEIILVENDENGEFEEIRNRIYDNRTRDYNRWILENGFDIDQRFDTYFDFSSLEEARKCFEVIYGKDISNKIQDKRIHHKILAFKYRKSDV